MSNNQASSDLVLNSQLTTYYVASEQADNASVNHVESSPFPDSIAFYVITMTQGSDYSGCSVTKSNFLSLQNEFSDLIELRGSHGTYGLGFFGDPSDDLIEVLSDLDGYPLHDDDAHSTIECELVDDAWNDHGRNDFKKALAKSGKCTDEEIGVMSDEDIDAKWNALVEDRNLNGGSGYVIETGCLVHFYIDEAVK